MIHANLTKEERIAKFNAWRAECAEYPSDYKIEFRNQRGEYVDVCFMRFAENEWYVLETLERWFFKHES